MKKLFVLGVFALSFIICLISCDNSQAQGNSFLSDTEAGSINTIAFNPAQQLTNSAVKNDSIIYLCGKPTKSGNPCKNHVKQMGYPCHLHATGAQPQATAAPTHLCGSTTKSGNPCKNRTSSQFCHLHTK